MRIIHDKLEFLPADGILIHHLEEAFKITPNHIRALQDLYRPYFIQIDATEVFAEEQVLDFALGGLVDIQPLVIEEFDIDHPLIVWRDLHMHPTDSISGTNKVACNRDGNLIDILDVHACRWYARHNATFNHTRCPVVSITVNSNGRTFRKNRRVCRPKLGCKLWSDVNIDQPGDTKPAE